MARVLCTSSLKLHCCSDGSSFGGRALLFESLKDDKTAINTKVSKMMGLLEKHGHLYQQLLSPRLLLVHPANRCGMLVNSFV